MRSLGGFVVSERRIIDRVEVAAVQTGGGYRHPGRDDSRTGHELFDPRNRGCSSATMPLGVAFMRRCAAARAAKHCWRSDVQRRP